MNFAIKMIVRFGFVSFAIAQTPGSLAPRNYAVQPPLVESATVELLRQPVASNNARVTVRFREPLPRVINLTMDWGTATLRDDGREGDIRAGDRVYSSLVRLNLAEFQALQRKLAAKPGESALIYDGRTLLKRIPATSVLSGTIRPGAPINFTPAGVASNVDGGFSLLITEPSVVQDPGRTRTSCTTGSMGVWSFGYLMTQMANTPLTHISPEDFVYRWLQRFEFDQIVNDQLVPGGGVANGILASWPTKPDGITLDLSKAPFQLLAIVNRIDLRENFGYGGGKAGELRFVFGLVDPNNGCGAKDFVVIFEFGVDRKNCSQLKSWAQQWLDLANASDWNQAVENITQQVVVANKAPSKPNGSALNQLRTNHASTVVFWQLHEFKISNITGHLEMAPVKQTPADGFNNSQRLADFLASGAINVPLQFPLGQPFLGPLSGIAKGAVPWASPSSDPVALARFAKNTCNGCHSTATNPPTLAPFHHISDNGGFSGLPASVSQFVANDMVRREADLDALANTSCSVIFLDTFLNTATNQFLVFH